MSPILLECILIGCEKSVQHGVPLGSEHIYRWFKVGMFVCIDAAHLVAFGYCAYRQCSCAQAPTPHSMLPPHIGNPTTFEFCTQFEFFERFCEQDLECLLGTITMPKARTQPVKRLRNPQPARVDRSYASRAQPQKPIGPQEQAYSTHFVTTSPIKIDVSIPT